MTLARLLRGGRAQDPARDAAPGTDPGTDPDPGTVPARDVAPAPDDATSAGGGSGNGSLAGGAFEDGVAKDGTPENGSSGDGTSDDGPPTAGPSEGARSGKKGPGDGSSGDGSSGDGLSGDGSSGDGSSGDGSSGDGLSGDGSSGDEPSGNGSSGDGLSGDGLSGDDGSSGDEPSGDGSSRDEPSADGPSADGPSADGPSADRVDGVRAPRPPGGRLRRAALAGVAAALVLGGCGFLYGAHQLKSAESARNRALTDTEATHRVAGEVANALARVFSYTPDGTAAAERSARSVLDGRAARQYQDLFDQVREDLTEQRVTLSTRAVRTGVIELDGERARLLVFLDQTSRRDKDEATTAAAQLTVTARLERDRWRIVDLKAR